jgi:hypothetical protein
MAARGEWVLLAAVTAGSRFIPLPVVDDLVKERARRVGVARILKEKRPGLDITRVAALYSDGFSVGRLVLTLPLKILLYPVRKIAKVIGAAHGVPDDMIDTLLLFHTVQRRLGLGDFQMEDPKLLKEEAETFRRVFKQARKGTNLPLLQTGLGEAMVGVKKVGELVTALVRAFLAKDEIDINVPTSAESEALGNAGEEVLEEAGVAQEIARFDQRFDALVDEANLG